MVHVDLDLIRFARTLSVNARHIRDAIFQYEQAVWLHDEEAPGHIVYQVQYEKRLRELTKRQRAADRHA